MAQPYLDRLTATFRAANPPEPRGVIVECKHFFSGAALYVDGLIFATLTPAGFAIKLPEQPAPISSRPAGAGGSGTSHEGRSRKTTSCCLAHSPPIASRCARCFARLSRMSHGKMTGWERRDGPPTERRARRRQTIEPWPGTTHVIDNVAACGPTARAPSGADATPPPHARTRRAPHLHLRERLPTGGVSIGRGPLSDPRLTEGDVQHMRLSEGTVNTSRLHTGRHNRWHGGGPDSGTRPNLIALKIIP